MEGRENGRKGEWNLSFSLKWNSLRKAQLIKKSQYSQNNRNQLAVDNMLGLVISCCICIITCFFTA